MARIVPSSGSTAVWVAAVLLIVYLLSPGPLVYLMYGSGLMSDTLWLEETMTILYVPIVFLANHVPYVSEFYLWYFEWLGLRL